MQAELLHCHNGSPGLAVPMLTSRASGAERSMVKTEFGQFPLDDSL